MTQRTILGLVPAAILTARCPALPDWDGRRGPARRDRPVAPGADHAGQFVRAVRLPDEGNRAGLHR